MFDIVNADLPLPIAIVTLIEHWRGPVQRADFVTDYGETGQLAMKAGLIGHPSVGYADLTPTGRLVRQQTLRLKHVQIDGDYSAAPIPEGVLRLISRFTDDGYLHARNADSKQYIDVATELGVVAPTWPPRRLALTAKGQALRQAALWTAPAEGDVYDDEDDAVVEEAEEPVTVVGRPLSIFGGAPTAKLAADVAERPERPRRGRKPGSKNKPKPPPAAPVSVRGPDAVEANVMNTARAMAARAEPRPVVDGAEAAAARKRELDAKIRRWTTTTRR
jgi:hypothetical protein